MTNREYLNALSDEDFTALVLAKRAELSIDNFKNWLAEEHKEVNKAIIKELGAGAKFKYAGYEFTKLADEEESCYCLLNGTVFESKFGETNDWAKSRIRERLNEFDEKGENKAIRGIKEKDLISVSLNYYSYKNPNGRTSDKITILSYEEAWAYDFKNVDKYTWLRSGADFNTANSYVLSAAGGMTSNGVYDSYRVRPALHLKSDIEVEVEE